MAIEGRMHWAGNCMNEEFGIDGMISDRHRYNTKG